MSPLVGASGALIDASAVTVSPTCISGIGSAPGAEAGPADQSLGSVATLCVKDSQLGPGGSTNGQFVIDGDLSLRLPAFQRADIYAAVLTVTLA
jgi:hypothetical protein